MKPISFLSIIVAAALFLQTGCSQTASVSDDWQQSYQSHQGFKGWDQSSNFTQGKKFYGNLKVSEQELLSTAYRYLGVAYRWGGTTPKGFDCSGFVSYIYKKFNVDIPRVSHAQYNPQRHIADPRHLKVGDLVFFSGAKISNRIGHVGIVSKVNPKNGTFAFVHSARRGVQETSSENSYYKRRYLKACAGPLR